MINVLVIYSGKLGSGGANVFLQDLLDYVSKITKAQFYLVSIWTRRGSLYLESWVRSAQGYRCLARTREPLCMSNLDRVLDHVSKFVNALIITLRPNLVIVNSVDPVVLNIVEKVVDRTPRIGIIVHDGGFFCPLKHMWDPIKSRPCSIPCLELGEVPEYCVATSVLLKLSYIQPLFNPLKHSFSRYVKIVVKVNKETLHRLWEVSRRALERSIVITPSKFMASIVKRFASVDAIVIRHGAPPELFVLACKPRRSPRVNIGFVGDVSLHKGVHVFLEAINNLINELDKSVLQRITFYIVGRTHTLSNTSAGIVNRYKHLLNKYVRFLGNIKSRVRIYDLLDVVVLPSVCHESAGLTVIEGMASGRYIVASSVGGVPEYLNNYPRGVLVEPGDAHMLAEALKHVIDKAFTDEEPKYVDVSTMVDVARAYVRVLMGEDVTANTGN